jgi:hypothetical protein
MGLDASIYITKIYRDWFRHSKINKGDIQTYREHEDIVYFRKVS